MFAALHGLYWFCAELSERAPLLLAVDDADRADQASLRFLAHLAPRLEGLPVAVAVARRPAGAGAPEQLLTQIEQHAAVRLSPPPLTAGGLRGVVGERLGEGDPEFFAACHRAAQGNPFLLGELCATLRAEGVAPTAAAAPLVETLGPRNIAHSSLTRIGWVAPGARRLVQAAALMGQDGELRHAADARGAGPLARPPSSPIRWWSWACSPRRRRSSSSTRWCARPSSRTSRPARGRSSTRARRGCSRTRAPRARSCARTCCSRRPRATSGSWTQLHRTARTALEHGRARGGGVAPRARPRASRRLRASAPGCSSSWAERRRSAPIPQARWSICAPRLAAPTSGVCATSSSPSCSSMLWHLGRREELLELARTELDRCDRDAPSNRVATAARGGPDQRV